MLPSHAPTTPSAPFLLLLTLKVKEADGALPCEAGEAMACGSVVRLEHVATGKNLHSHLFKSPLSRAQEVSSSPTAVAPPQ